MNLKEGGAIALDEEAAAGDLHIHGGVLRDMPCGVDLHGERTGGADSRDLCGGGCGIHCGGMYQDLREQRTTQT